MNGRDDVPEWIPKNREPAGRAVPPGRSGGPGRPVPGPFRPRPPARPHLAPPRPAGPVRPPARPPGRHTAPGGRHTAPGRRRRGAPFWGPMAGAAALSVLAGLSVFALAGAGDCGGEDAITLNVSAAPEVAAVVTEAAGRFNDAGHEIGDRCARARVTASDPAAVSTLLSGRGVAGVTERPDVWIPDSSLWAVMAQRPLSGGRTAGGDDVPIVPRRSLASTPIVVAVPGTLAQRLGAQSGAPPSWAELLTAAGATGDDPAAGAATTRIPPGLVRLKVPDPARTATGMGSVLLADELLNSGGGGDAGFTGVVRTLRESVTPSVQAEFASFRRDRQGRHPVALAPEQAVFAYNGRGPAEPAVAVYPSEGTMAMDYQITLVGAAGSGGGGDDGKAQAARLLEEELTGERTRGDLQGLGFRSPSGKAPGAFGGQRGVDPRSPRLLPAPAPADVQRIMQSWARLSLGIRMLSVIDVSGSMEEEVAPDVTRLQSTVRTAQGGLSLLPDDTELGQWVFSTGLEGGQDWRELVSVGPLGERLGSATRRQLVLSAFARIRAVHEGDTGLYDTVVAAFDHMKRTYKPEFVNSVLLWTDGRNDDPGGPSLKETLDRLGAAYDPGRPVQVIMFGYGRDVDVDELRQIARATRGDVLVAQTPGEVQKLFLQAVSRRVCAPSC
ncbi:substrate-binding domain-containing protein [Actinomadura vinacea]|uniref:Substrate-binding domain-containing protein n=1 Tax=Actinomadura vinacea TaxID=115336 RepID=A0ABP5XIU4_9ACTN